MKTDFLKEWPEQDIETLIAGYPRRGSKVRKDFIIERTAYETRKAARALGVRFIIVPWTMEEDIIVCRGYMTEKTAAEIIKELVGKGYPRRSKNDIHKKRYNFRYMQYGTGFYYKYSEQSKEAFILVTGNTKPHSNPLKKKKGGEF